MNFRKTHRFPNCRFHLRFLLFLIRSGDLAELALPTENALLLHPRRRSLIALRLFILFVWLNFRKGHLLIQGFCPVGLGDNLLIWYPFLSIIHQSIKNDFSILIDNRNLANLILLFWLSVRITRVSLNFLQEVHLTIHRKILRHPTSKIYSSIWFQNELLHPNGWHPALR